MFSRDAKQKHPPKPQDVEIWEIEEGITAEVYDCMPPHDWFWIIKIAAQNDITRHARIRTLALYHVLAYADDIVRHSQPATELEPAREQ